MADPIVSIGGLIEAVLRGNEPRPGPIATRSLANPTFCFASEEVRKGCIQKFIHVRIPIWDIPIWETPSI
jgi:hypothetical protein